MTPKIINEYDVFLQELFSSSEDIWFADKLKSVVAAQFDKEYPAARKILERAVKKGVMKSSSPMSFGKGMFAYYANEKKIYFNDLLEMSENRRPPVYRLLLAIKACGGLLSYYEALKVTSSQLTKSSNIKIIPFLPMGILMTEGPRFILWGNANILSFPTAHFHGGPRGLEILNRNM